MTTILKTAQHLYATANPANPQDPKFAEAMLLLTQLIDANPTSENAIDALALRFHIHYLSADAHAALTDLDLALNLQPRSANLWYNRGFVNRHLKQFGEAAADFRKCMQLANSQADDDLYDTAEDCLNEVLASQNS